MDIENEIVRMVHNAYRKGTQDVMRSVIAGMDAIPDSMTMTKKDIIDILNDMKKETEKGDDQQN